ncbi:hypothetical protein LIER_10926 [Lithospermum erythrorhizon]|uniref:Uncharacterized protein n=1 Tax=Lithospermum erythrorhizon TaxID=34254 RepID=A0AAV3PMG4_LITER
MRILRPATAGCQNRIITHGLLTSGTRSNPARSSSSPQVSSFLSALAGSGSSVLLQATALASRAPSSSRRPPDSLAPKPTDRANAPPPGLKIIFVIALEIGVRVSVHPCVLASVTPIAEFFLTSFSLRTQKDDFLYFTVRIEMKGFYEAFASKVEPKIWRPFFFYTSSEGLPQGVPFEFTSHPKSNGALPRTAKH